MCTDEYRAKVDAAQRKLDAAVDEFFTECEYDGVMTSWALVAHHASIMHSKDASSYGLATMHNSAPPHVIEGLLRRGIAQLNDGLYDMEESDEE